MIRALPRPALLRRLGRDTSGLALLEFAFILPVVLTLSLAGAEMTNYIITKMRISQIALHLADNASRIGSGSQLQAKTISEIDINDLLTGAQLQSGELDLFTNGRVIISDLEPMANPNTRGKYKIVWQRCKGAVTGFSPQYGNLRDASTTTSNMDGMGPQNRQVIAPDGGATMYVEVYYNYKPLIRSSLTPGGTITEIASMMVRDRRDLSQIYNAENVAKASC